MCSMDVKSGRMYRSIASATAVAFTLTLKSSCKHLCILYMLLCITNSVTCDVSVAPNSALIDLSWPYNQNTLVWVDLRNYTMDIVYEGDGKFVNSDGSKVWVRHESIALSIHTATHMDAPFHFARDKWSVDEIPIEHFVDRPLVVLDVQKKVFKNRDYQVTEHDLFSWEQENGLIPEASILFIHTGYGKFYPDRLKYLNLIPGSKSSKDIRYPGMHRDAADWLVRNRLVLGVGIDTISIDSGASKSFHSHQILLDRNMFIIENLNSNLSQVPATGAKVNIFPLKFEAASGSPCRVIVNINSSSFARASVTLITFALLITLLPIT